MNSRFLFASLLLIAVEAPGCAPAAFAGEAQSLPQVQAVRYVFDCRVRTLPSQREVGEWAGQHNFAQVYDTREKLMAAVARACSREGIERVNLVQQVPADQAERMRTVASTGSAGR